MRRATGVLLSLLLLNAVSLRAGVFCERARPAAAALSATAHELYGGHQMGQDFIERVIDRVWNHMANHMAQRHGCGMHGIENGVHGSHHFKGGKRSRVVWNLRCDGAFQCVTGIGFCVDQRHINAFFIEAGGSGEIRNNPVVIEAYLGHDHA